MEQILGTVKLDDQRSVHDDQRSVHIATLSRQTVIENDAAHLGFDGYFVFESSDIPDRKGITILGKACSVETAYRLIDVWQSRDQVP